MEFAKKCDDEGCVQCKPDITTCTNCGTKLFLFKGDCVDKCPTGTFLKGSECLDCELNCVECQNDQICKKCKTGFSLENDDCVKECSKGKVSVNGVCTPCTDANCQICYAASLGRCKKCTPPYFLNYDYSCVKQCPIGYYYDEDIYSCSPCDKSCQTCDNAKTCKSCAAPKLLYNGQCADKCPIGMVGRI